ncbi:uncharacterized protein LOC126616504 isoform X1 [Malus sylvestris]|uniref:uncharacterized protein LOC126616504 isoform X1 n=1 Tax=Malus sylvestris TaxID=3752 RepID=UPI0021ABA291|nr:uncharacterized protein LOC126616504 isoform X1 [Malus sylvestris]
MVPTRTDVPECMPPPEDALSSGFCTLNQKLTSQVHEIVGRINGRFGTLTAVAMRHLDRSLHLHALCALYAVTDTTTWIRSPNKAQKGEWALDVVLEKSVVKQSGDAWRIILHSSSLCFT